MGQEPRQPVASSVWSAVLVVALALVALWLCIAVVVVRCGFGGDLSVAQGNNTDVDSDVELLIGVWLSRRVRSRRITNAWLRSCAKRRRARVDKRIGWIEWRDHS
ncbi:hypothetical protein PF008_g29998 [Phytophthora fragariae]|uniref:Uncharacterized protein n=1 Tax=Phytophthora fragariae TaxID=53985 RepID=A0A6G0Q6V0_9STRA|nr:hypothetical protein PF008_g29998 [Phytophthora fragariae]